MLNPSTVFSNSDASNPYLSANEGIRYGDFNIWSLIGLAAPLVAIPSVEALPTAPFYAEILLLYSTFSASLPLLYIVIVFFIPNLSTPSMINESSAAPKHTAPILNPVSITSIMSRGPMVRSYVGGRTSSADYKGV